jgi:hypothetical protein
MSFKVSSYHWIPDLPDHRDHLYYAAPAEVAGALPASLHLRAQCLSVCHRGQIGSCTANAIAGPIQSGQMKQNSRKFSHARGLPYAYVTAQIPPVISGQFAWFSD